MRMLEASKSTNRSASREVQTEQQISTQLSKNSKFTHIHHSSHHVSVSPSPKTLIFYTTPGTQLIGWYPLGFVFHLLFLSYFKFCLDQTPPEQVIQDVQWLRESGLFSQDQVDIRVSYIQVFSYLMLQGSTQ